MTILMERPRQPRHAQITPPSSRRWRFPWAQAIASLIILVGLCVLLYPQAAAWFAQREQSRVVEMAQIDLDKPPTNDSQYRADQINQAHLYNDNLASGALFEAHANVPVGDGEGTGSSIAYSELLNTSETGFMGRLHYDSLAIDLPIYHGASDDTLTKGVGHLEGTSLPVGGAGTRSVLTAHRGLPSATMFDALDQAKQGDTFTVSVLDQVLTYQVIGTKVIKPEETEEIRAIPGEDLVTLITCTPLGLNTHRILVTAERVTPTPPADIAQAAQAPNIPGFPWWLAGLTAAFIGAGVYTWASGRPPQEKTRRNRSAEALAATSVAQRG